MRHGDFAVEVVPRGKGVGVREVSSGQVLARPGQVYAIRLRNFGPLRCVADVRIDGRTVTAGGLVIEPWCTEELERPIAPDEDGCFTVVAEGDEGVFGPDGGRDNPDLGLIEVKFRRELPGGRERARPLPPTLLDTLDHTPAPASGPDRRPPDVFPIWNVMASGQRMPNGQDRFGGELPEIISKTFGLEKEPLAEEAPTLDDAERAAGTGLTGHSNQRFRATRLGPLESEATVIQLRLVIASAEVITSTSPLRAESSPPARPAARP